MLDCKKNYIYQLDLLKKINIYDYIQSRSLNTLLMLLDNYNIIYYAIHVIK